MATLRPNPAFAAKYPFLFDKTTPAEEGKLVTVRLVWFVVWWHAASAYAAGLLPSWLFFTIISVVMLRWYIANHDCLHMRSAQHQGMAFRVLNSPPLGFLPLASTFGDNLHQHLKDHHLHTKSVLDVHDPDSWWSQLPLGTMLLGMLVSPSDMGAYEVLGQYLHGPSSLWPERLAATALAWGQYALLHRMGILWPALAASHLGSAATFIFFHGLLHRPSWYALLLRDPSGLRRLHPLIDALFGAAIDPAAWIEIKFHDAHHSHGAANQVGCTHIHYASGRATAAQIEEALASMVDEGLFLDAEGKPRSALESVGHQVGVRRAYLDKRSDEPPGAAALKTVDVGSLRRKTVAAAA